MEIATINHIVVGVIWTNLAITNELYIPLNLHFPYGFPGVPHLWAPTCGIFLLADDTIVSQTRGFAKLHIFWIHPILRFGMALDPDGKRNDMEAFCSWKTWSYYRATRCNWGKFRHEFGQHFTSLPYHLWIRHIIRHIAIQIEGEKNRASSHPPSPQPFDGRGRVCV